MVCKSWELCVFSVGLPIPVFKESVTVHESSMKEKCKQLYFFCLFVITLVSWLLHGERGVRCNFLPSKYFFVYFIFFANSKEKGPVFQDHSC